jgi:predicted alpha/beta-fold hydrolase
MDSDDVRLIIQHIMSAQTEATVMEVGWGFGANMLAKYLGEEAGSTSLLAAVCISNPLDLQETSRHLSRTKGGKFDRAMADGFVRILEANKVSLTQQTLSDFSQPLALRFKLYRIGFE